VLETSTDEPTRLVDLLKLRAQAFVYDPLTGKTCNIILAQRLGIKSLDRAVTDAL